MTELALLAAQVGVSERTLRRAVNQGTLRATRGTPRTLAISLSEKKYVRRSWSVLATLRTALRTESNVRLAVVFGSTARGTDTSRSDVDVLVDLRDASLERVVDLSAKLTMLVGRPVDVLRLQDAEAELSLLADVVADGRVLVDRDQVWSRLRRTLPSLQRRGHEQDARRTEAALASIDRLLAA